MMKEKILVVDDDVSVCEFLSILLEKEGYQVTTRNDGKKAMEAVKEENFDVVVTDIRLPGTSGLDLLGAIRDLDPTVPVIIMTGHSSEETAIQAVNNGAFYYLLKTTKREEIAQVIRKAAEVRHLRAENRLLRRELRRRRDSREIVGRCAPLQELLQMVRRVAPSDSTVLITGESGTGKELIAREIHFRSHRSQGPFVSINCGALPENLLESELFGHVKGSFTGAVKDKEGLFVVAAGGTFFLDEVAETSPAIQVKLLRVLQEREVIPVGGVKPIPVDVRLIAATNADLEQEVFDGRFRADLYYRLNVIPVVVPPLRERAEDIPLLVENFIARMAEERRMSAKTVSPEAVDYLVRYSWPGNVRELENVVERAFILQEGHVLLPEDLPAKVRMAQAPRTQPVLASSNVTIEELEKQYMLQVLEQTGWHKKRASAILGIDASTLYRKLQRYGLTRQRETSGAPAGD
jgi:DNA-binding NtrC family response regulator